MSRLGRALAVAAGVVLLGVGVVYAVLPFDHVVTFDAEAWTPVPGSHRPFTFGVSGECRAAVLAATSDGEPVALWAVTVGTEAEGYTPVFGDDVKTVLNSATALDGGHVDLPDRACSTRARERLVASAIFIGGAFGIMFVVWRRRRTLNAIGQR